MSAVIRQDSIRKRSTEKRNEATTITVSVNVPCVASYTDLHTANKYAAPRNAAKRTIERSKKLWHLNTSRLLVQIHLVMRPAKNLPHHGGGFLIYYHQPMAVIWCFIVSLEGLAPMKSPAFMLC